MRYIPAVILSVVAALCWLMSLGNKPGAAMSSSFMIVPAAGFGIVAALAAIAAWAL